MSQRDNSPVRIGLVQTAVTADLDVNQRRTVTRIRQAAKQGAQVVCLQELYRTRYFPIDEKVDAAHLAEPIPGRSTKELAKLAKELAIVIVVPIYERAPDGRFYNTAVVIDADGSLSGAYRKVHIPHDPYFYEQNYFAPGDGGYRVFHTRYLKFAVLICYDQWFPEAARAVSLLGADLVFYPTAIGYLKGDPLPPGGWIDAWTTIQRSHAIANSVHIAAVNRVGVEGPTRFWGGSFVCDAFGQVLAQAGDRTAVTVADIDVSQNRRIREGWRFMHNRRPDTYAAITAPLADDTPRALGYRMPAEWEPHSATWLAWPHDRDTFPARVRKVEKTYTQIITALHATEIVCLVVRNEQARARVSGILARAGIDLGCVDFHVWDYADVWFRDYGPTFIVNGQQQLAAVQWRFNAWGDKYPDLARDGHAPYFISEELGLPLFRPGIILEGGAIDVNGQGTALTTEQCLLNPNRNPAFTRRKAEKVLHDYLGVSRVIWLKQGLDGDDTDGHIDNLARFVGPRTVLCAWEDDRDDVNYATLRSNYNTLKRAKDQDGHPLKVIRVPMPAPKAVPLRGAERRLSESYMNFYVANGIVLVPQFNDPLDAVVLAAIQQAFPDRRAVGIECTDLVFGAGTLHCISQQQPAPAGRRV